MNDFKEQAKEKMEAANERIKEIGEKFHRNPKYIAEYLAFGSRFYQYSVKNTKLIFGQNPYATYVQSFAAWKAQGYSVKRGAKSMNVLTPVKATYLYLEGNKLVLFSKATKAQQEAYKQGHIRGKEELHFKIGNVFDISQTTFPKEDYPKLFQIGYPSEQHIFLVKALEDYCKGTLHCNVLHQNMNSIALRGTYSSKEKVIRINELLDPSEQLSTLAHEMGHAMYDHKGGISPEHQSELEADSISILLHSHLGIEITEGQKDHLADHYKSFVAELKEKNPEVENAEELDKVLNQAFVTFREHVEGIDQSIDKSLEKDHIKEEINTKDLEHEIFDMSEEKEEILSHRMTERYQDMREEMLGMDMER